MGNWIYKCFSNKSPAPSLAEKVEYSWDKRKLTDEEENDKDNIFENIEDQTIVRKFNSSTAIQFQNVKNSTIIIPSQVSQTLIDNIQNSTIFIGVCDDSIFIRNSKNCTIICTSNQIRLRDVDEITLCVYCSSKLAIEECTNLTIVPWHYNYKNLYNQLKKADMTQVYNNFYYKIHDFTNLTEQFRLPGTKVVNYVAELPTSEKLDSIFKEHDIVNVLDSELPYSSCPIPYIYGKLQFDDKKLCTKLPDKLDDLTITKANTYSSEIENLIGYDDTFSVMILFKSLQDRNDNKLESLTDYGVKIRQSLECKIQILELSDYFQNKIGKIDYPDCFYVIFLQIDKSCILNSSTALAATNLPVIFGTSSDAAEFFAQKSI